MAKTIKPKASDWQARELRDWNATTFRAYLEDRHGELYALPYIARNYGAEARMLKTMIDAYGPEVVRSFIDAAFADYKQSAQYPTINFAFMYSYMREKLLPRILVSAKRKTAEADSSAALDDDAINWL